jgi:SAM-dependent methyltransferase
MLDIAQNKLPGIDFYCQDMAEFVLDQQFDIVISLFSAIGYVRTKLRLRQALVRINEHLKPGGIVIIEPWFTPEEFEKHRSDVLFGQRENFKACRMRECVVEDHIAFVSEHILISKDNQVMHFVSDHVFGLFDTSDFLEVFTENGFRVHFDEKGLTGRGLYIGIKE